MAELLAKCAANVEARNVRNCVNTIPFVLYNLWMQQFPKLSFLFHEVIIPKQAFRQ